MATVTLTLSPERICSEIYARSALHHIDPATTPTLLTAAQSAALMLLVQSEIESFALSAGALTAGGSSPEQCAITLSLSAVARPQGIASAIERIVALTVLAEIVYTAEAKYASSLLAAAEATRAVIARHIAPSQPPVRPRLTPHPF